MKKLLSKMSVIGVIILILAIILYFVRVKSNIDTFQQENRRVVLKDIPWYFLTTGKDIKRKTHMYQEFHDVDLKEVNPVLIDENISKLQSAASGFCKMIDRGLREQDYKSPFKPFILLEDDVSKYRGFPKYIDIPHNCDILYIGLSKWGIPSNGNIGRYNHVFFKYEHKDFIKIENMLNIHGVMVCSPAGANAMTRSISEDFFKNLACDISIAKTLNMYHVYALREPLVYQDRNYRGMEESTRFDLLSTTQKNESVKAQGDFNILTNIHTSFGRATSYIE